MYIYGFPKYIFSFEKEVCPLGATRNQIIHLCKFKLKRICNYAYFVRKMQNFPRASPRLCPFPPSLRGVKREAGKWMPPYAHQTGVGRSGVMSWGRGGGAWNTLERTLTFLGLAREDDSVGFHWAHGTAVG